MKLYGLAAALVLCLAACGSEAPPTVAETRQGAEMPPDVPVMGEERTVLALGDSLFTGYGLGEGESYPALLEAALRARGINARMVNAGVSGDTTAAGRNRLAFALDAQATKPDLVVISLGGNDMLRGLPVEQTRENLDAILAELKERGIETLLLGMLAAPNLGEPYAREFNAIYPALAKKYGAALVPFFLQPVMDRPELVQADRIHPTREGIEAMVADTVDDVAGALGQEN
ncbi:MAG: arylesterase [Sphingomonadaceae bacterium]